MPSVAGFKPIASDCYRKDAIFLHFEEYEAIRLCDYEMQKPARSICFNGGVTSDS